MKSALNHIVIVGGGSAGWLTAGVLAAQFNASNSQGITITLIESATVPPIGVGEGTWPSMRATLQKIGLSETDFLQQCDASFKQGSVFHGWQNGQDSYYHPFTPPAGFQQINLAEYWQPFRDQVSFADAVCPQGKIAALGLAPKMLNTEEYGFALNYGYHLDAGKFGQCLQAHCINKLGVKQIIADVVKINSDDSGDIASVTTDTQQDITGDLFIDCSGMQSLLLGQHFGIELVKQDHVLFNNSAIAAQVPYVNEHDPIASFTHSTAQTAGWIWDIGLPSRRGVGYTFSSAHCDAEQAETSLRQYLTKSIGEQAAQQVATRHLQFTPGHRAKFWHRNCVAIGMAAGFIEPLEASAIAMVELSAKMLAEQMPANRQVMDIIAERFNASFDYRWQRIIEFLKLHYVLTKRSDSDYWIDNCERNTIPAHLQQQLALWQYHFPYHWDTHHTEELFPAASFQYILYGMGFNTKMPQRQRQSLSEQAAHLFNQNVAKGRQLQQHLSSNRTLLEQIKQHGLARAK
ncbi:tryptophan halogenase family protein [Shewanella waksmanii]|uniref:tryptophan halogenase family protein n=1 Tax=Shewanella waksmanii TaxID=213783 RepID=UPI00373516A1